MSVPEGKISIQFVLASRKHSLHYLRHLRGCVPVLIQLHAYLYHDKRHDQAKLLLPVRTLCVRCADRCAKSDFAPIGGFINGHEYLNWIIPAPNNAMA